MTRKEYSTDLTDAQWERIAPLIPPAKPGGRPRSVDMREVLNGILYVLRSGCAWRLMPHDLPHWRTVYGYFRRFGTAGVWKRIHDRLREQVRRSSGRKPTPSAAIIDSQSVKTTEKGGGADTMQARRSTAGNATSWWTPWASSWRSSSMRPRSRTGTAQRLSSGI